MFEEPFTDDSNPGTPPGGNRGAAAPAGSPVPPPRKGTAPDLRGVTGALTDTLMADAFADLLPDLELDLDELACTDRLTTLEKLKAAASAAEVKATALLHEIRCGLHAKAGRQEGTRGWGTGTEVALARHESPDIGRKYASCSRILARDMPLTLAALGTGFINEERAMIIAHEARNLTHEARTLVDTAIHERPADFTGEGTGALTDRVRRLVQEIDPLDMIARADKARAKRYLNIYPAPDGMMTLHGSLPVEMGLLMDAVLTDLAASLKAAGDHRTRNQIRADECFELLTGAGANLGCPVTVNLVMTAGTLFLGEAEPAHLAGYGSVPAAWARRLIRGTDGDVDAARWIQRLFTAPGAGELLAMDAKKRRIPAKLREFIQIRDRICQTPFCNGTGEHIDHIRQWSRGGSGNAINLLLREAFCNQTKEGPGWKEKPIRIGRHGVEVTTPAGRTYRSLAPPLPGTRVRR